MSVAQQDVLAFLAQAASYGEPGARIERIETHASVVFLIGERALKVKRAVRFSYLDYSTLALRRKFCEAELAVGRHLAPKLYRALHAVTLEADGKLAIDGGGEPVEWLLEMRRFDQNALFDRLAESNRLTPALMRDLADEIAAFHAAAEPARDHGGSAGIRLVIDDCRVNLRQAADLVDGAAADALLDAQSKAWLRLAPLLDRRCDNGKVRRCHGDLHLRNICLFEGKPTLFDGIEFSDAIATIDVLYDLAFLLMDLHHRGHGELANLVLNRYLDRTADDAGLAALPLFLSVRAAIRAHVTTASARRQTDTLEASRLAEEARAYLSLAIALLIPRQPRLVAIGGVSGTGKTSLAHALAPDLGPVSGARIVRSDVLRKREFGAAPETRLAPDAYNPEITERVYRTLCAQAAEALSAGYAVIADAVFLRPDEREAIAETARAKGVPFTGLWLDAPPDLLAHRIEARRDDASDADVEVMRRQLGHDPGAVAWARIDAGADASATAAKARSLLGSE
jgi:uncharacterized protein